MRSKTLLFTNIITQNSILAKIAWFLHCITYLRVGKRYEKLIEMRNEKILNIENFEYCHS